MLHPSNHLDIATVEAFKLDDFDPAAVTSVLNGPFVVLRVQRAPHASLTSLYIISAEANKKVSAAAPDTAEAAEAQIELEAATNLARALGVSV